MRRDVVVAVGTVKGAFLLRGDEVDGPLFKGDRVPSLALGAGGERSRMLAGTVSDHWGPVVRTSDDGGRTWSEPETRPLRFPADADASLVQIWQIVSSAADEPDTVYAGVEPAALFRSEDRGDTWELVRGLWDHPHRPKWEPGGGGLGLHTILIDPRDSARLLVAISAGGVYRSDDRGATWAPYNAGVRRGAVGDPQTDYPEFGQCVHKVARDAEEFDRLFLQNHGGLYRSDDNAESWVDMAHEVPSDFGFPIVAHPRQSGTAYVIPLESDFYRCVPDARCRVYRTTDAGASWTSLATGLPQDGAYLTVLRDAFCHDGADPLGLYFGTRTGQLYGSFDEGESWDLLADHLPPVLCVRAAAPA